MNNREFDKLLANAAKATNASEAEKCFNALVACLSRDLIYCSIDQIENIIRDYLSYNSVTDNDLRIKIESLYSCEHPWFGKATKEKPITASDAYKMGLEYGAQFLKDLELK